MALPPDERPASESRAGPACWAEKNSRLLLILILVLAAGLRFWNVTHGLDRPLAISVDDDADKKFASARSLALEGDVHLPAYRRHLLYRQPMFLLRSYAGIWRTVSVLGFHPSDRTMRIGFNAYLIVMSLVVAVLVFHLGRLVTNRAGPALWAAYLFAVAPANVVGTVYLKEDIPLMLWSTAAMLAMVAYVVSRRTALSLAAALLVGLAIGAKYTGVLLVPMLLVTHFLVALKSEDSGRLRGLLRWQTLLTPLLVAAGFLIFNHHALTEWGAFSDGVRYQLSYASVGHHDGTVITGRDHWWMFFLRHAIAPGITVPVTLLFLCGVVLAFVQRNRPASLLAITVVFSYLVLESSPAKPFPFPARYLHFIYPLAVVLAAYALGELWRRFARGGWHRPAAVCMGIALGAVPLVTSILVADGARPDTRDQAAAWIEDNLPDGSRIFMGRRRFCPQGLDPSRFQVNYFNNIERKTVAALQNHGVDFVVTSSFDHNRYRFSSRSTPLSREALEAYDRLERGLVLVRRFEPRFPCQSYGQHNPIITIYAVPD
ncbi:MAG TPA: glycosyltransferase family 39 protein [Thermoanaerobaculales bacterium]|nr:glycosyltransferase family 39 protein [Thermoanaerobaculales bacterium]HQN95454.1 glycosyltransferase family 39 protein [Thermoanaerobaculales bacterium]HQP42048.1 glycosyltransferase family 39 protein [Thermoanaerobaculales bacterium]